MSDQPEIKPSGLEGLYQVKDDGPIGPYHRKVKSVIEGILNIVTHVELECGHTVILFNDTEWVAKRGGVVYCGECAGVTK